jgi:hypothetical protein
MFENLNQFYFQSLNLKAFLKPTSVIYSSRLSMLNITTSSRGPNKKKTTLVHLSTLLFVHIPQALASSAKFILFLDMLQFLKFFFSKNFLVKENEAYLWNIWDHYVFQN